jgi:hypothetical protein
MDLDHDPEKMCDDHLLGNHNEAHQLVGYLQDESNISKLIGHAARGQIDLTQLQTWHDDLAEEMKRRGFDHASPLDAPDHVPIGEGSIGRSTTNKLRDRCDNYGDC